MKQLAFACCLFMLSLPLVWAQNMTPQKKWGLTWNTPKNWTRSPLGASGLEFKSPKGEEEMVVKVFPLGDAKTNEENIAKFFKDEADYSGDYASLAPQLAKLTLNGLSVRVYEDDEEPDLDEAEDPEDYEGYWTKVVILEHQKQLVLVYMSETYNRKRKEEKLFDAMYKSIKKG